MTHAQTAFPQRHPGVRGGRACEGFAKAATELHVTPAAISRMVQLLEQRLGVPLFERKANRLA
jgi:LysR family glycine cleavage system transcriptional activator